MRQRCSTVAAYVKMMEYLLQMKKLQNSKTGCASDEIRLFIYQSINISENQDDQNNSASELE